LSPEPDDDDDDDDVNNNDIEDDDQPSYAPSPLNTTGAFVELSLPDLTQDTSETFSSTAVDFADSFYTE